MRQTKEQQLLLSLLGRIFFLILIFIGSSGLNQLSAQTASFTVTATSGNCSPATLDFTDTSTGATSWSWDFGDFNTATTQDATEIYSSPGSYTVTLTINGNGSNGISSSQIVNVYPAPNPTIPTTVQGCEPFTGSLTAVSTPVVVAPFKINSSNVGGITGGAAISYKWDFSGALATQTTTTPVCNLTNVPAGTYNVLLTVTDENGCSGSISVPGVLTVSPLPAINNISTTSCSGGIFSVAPVNGTDGVVPAGTTYNWSAPSGSGFTGGAASSGSPASIGGTLVNSTDIPVVATYSVTPSAGNCTGTAFNVQVTVNPTGQVTNPGNQVVCNNSATAAITFATIRTGGATTYTWTNDTPGIGLAASSGGTSTGIPSFTATNNGTSPVTATITVTPTFTNGATGCTGIAQSFTITVNPSPIAIATPTSQTICSGSTTGIGLTTSTTGGTITYSWTAALTNGTATGFSNSSGSSISQTLTNNTNSTTVIRYTITPTIGACSGTPITVNITVNPVPTAIATPTSQTVCSGSATGIGLTTSTTGGTVTYSWTAALTSGTATGFSNGSGSTISQTLTNNTNSPAVVRYTITPAIGSCSGTPITVDITVNPAPTVIATPTSQTVCSGSTTGIGLTTSTTGGTVTYSWTAALSSGIATGFSNGSGSTISQTLTNNTNSTAVVRYTITPAIGTCSGTPITVNITVNPVPAAIATPISQTVCSGSTTGIGLTTSTTGGTVTYSWTAALTNGTATGFSNGSGSNISQTLTNNTNSPAVVRYTVTPTIGTCSGTPITVDITVNPAPTVIATPTSQIVCSGSPTGIGLTTSATGGTVTYSWTAALTNGIATGFSNGSGSTISQTLTNNTNSTAVVRYTITPAIGTCSGTPITVDITVNPAPTVIATPTSQTVCSGSATGIGFTTSTTGGTVTYSWTAALTSGTATGFSNGSGSNISQTLTNNTNSTAVVRYTVTPAIGACSGTPITVDITVNPAPTVIATPTSQTVCSGSTTGIGLTTSTTGGTVTYSWTAALTSGTATGFSNGSGSAISQTLTNNTNSPTVVRYTVTPAIGTCIGTPITVDITVNPTGQVTNPGNQAVYNNTNTSAVVFATTRSGGSTTYTWTNDIPGIGLAANSGGISTGIPSFTAINNSSSPVTATITVTPTFTNGTVGCAGIPQSFTFTVNPNGQLINPGNQVVCNNTSTTAIIFNTSNTGGITTYTWTNDTPGIGLATSSGGNSTGIPSFTAINNGTSPITATITVIPTFTSGGNSSTGASQSFTITVNPTGQVINPGNQAVCNNSGTAAITFATTRTGGVTTYSWTNDTSGIGLAASSGGITTGIPSFTATNNGTSPVTAIITVIPTFTNGAAGCAGTTQSFSITVNPTGQVNNPGNQSVCNNSGTAAITFATTRTGGVTTYTWTNDTPGIGLAASSGGTSTGIPSFTATNNGTSPVTATITVTPTFANGSAGCTGTSQIFTITVNPTPTVIVTPSQQTICSGSTTGIGLSTIITGATVTYSWIASLTSGTATGYSNGSGSTISQTLTNSTNSPAVVRYTVTPSIGTCSGTSNTVDITVNPTGQVNNPGNQTVCNNSVTAAITFATTRSGSLTTYSWINDTPGIGLAASGGGTGIPVFSAINDGTAPVTAAITVIPTFTNGAASCTGTSQNFTITVNPTGQVNNPGNQVVCNNSGTGAITFSTTRTGGITTYTWTNDTPGIGLASSSGGTSTGIPTFTATNIGTSAVTATITVTPTFTNGSAGCTGTPQSFTITVNPSPTAIATPTSQTICSGSATGIGLSTVITGATITYSWVAALISGNATGFSNGSGSTITQTLSNSANSPAVVRYTITPSLSTCSGIPITVDITVNPTPAVNATPTQQTICSGSSTGIGLSTNTVGATVTYSWIAALTSGTATGYSNGSGSTIAQTLTNSTISPAVVRYTVTPAIGTCSGTPITVDITINPLPSPVNDFKILKAGETLTDNVLTNDGVSLTVKQFVINGTTYPAGNLVPISGVGSLSLNPTGDYVFIPVPGFVGGVPVIAYTVGNTSGCTATATLTITVNTVIIPVPESGTIPATGGTAINNVAVNDVVNGLPALVGTGGNSTISQSGIWSGGITLVPTTGAVNVARGTIPGAYSVTYQLCDKLIPETCGLMVDQVTVSPVITPVTESGTISALGGTVIANIAGNDIVNGLPAVLGTGGNATVSQSGSWPAGITLVPSTGAITVAKGVTQGTYSVGYQLCDLLTPQNCAIMVDQVTVTTVIIPLSESGIIPATGGTVIANVVNNDLVNGLPAVLGTGRNCAVSQSGSWPAGITLDTATGAVKVAPGTTPGTYPVTYQLCDLLTPQTCSSMVDQVTVTPVITTVTENGTIAATGGTVISNIAGNDMLNGLPAILGNGGNSTVSQNGTWPQGITLDPLTGAIHVARGTTPATYPIIYQLCDLLTPQTCALMIDQVTVTPLITPVSENGTIPATGGIAINNIAGNDVVNGLPAKLGNLANCTVSQNGIWPVGITLDPLTGNISVAKGTIPGTYSVSYQLCDLLTPRSCALIVDQVTVTSQVIPQTESGTIPATGGTVISNVSANDVLNGLPALLGTNGNCTLSMNGNWPAGITLDPITGNINVANGTLPGTYSVTYQLCDLRTPQTCSLMVDQVIVTSLISPKTENGSIPATGGIAITNIVGNDMVNGHPAILGTGGNCTITGNGTWPTGISLDPITGNVIVDNGTVPGTYSFTYQLCDLLTPQTCSLMVDQLIVTPLISQKTESGTIAATGGIAITNIVANDVVNGRPAVLGAGGNCTISQNGNWPTGITLDASTGNISVANGTAPGTYPVTYQLCDELTSQTCALIVDQITVTAACDLSVIKTADNSSPVIGKTIVFTLTATNKGPSNATGVKVIDLLPAGYTFVSDDRTGSYVSGTGSWSIGNLSKGTTEVLNISAIVNVTGPYSNTATISGLEKDPVLGNNTSTNTPVPVLSNLKPIANNDSISTNENIVVSYNVMNNDIPSIKGGNVWTLATNPKHGTITFYPDGTFTYIPTMNFSGIDTFTYILTDVVGDTSIARVTINVLATPKVIMKASKPVMNNDGTFNWKYTITIINDTNQSIDSVQVVDNLDEVFKTKGCSYVVTGITASGSLLSNGLYNGSSIMDALIDGKTMAVSKQDSIMIGVSVDTHGQKDTVSVFNQALFTGNSLLRKLNILSDADITTRPFDPTQTVLPVVDLFIPEGFSPNNDSYNDKFVITHSLAVKVNFEVFNRWGNSVYKSSDYQNDWDGKGTGNFLGKDLPTGTYYCIYAVYNATTGEILNKGEKYITLRR